MILVETILPIGYLRCMGNHLPFDHATAHTPLLQEPTGIIHDQ